MYIFGKDLEALRLYGGFTKKKLSEELNVCTKTIKNYVLGRKSVGSKAGRPPRL